MNAHADISGERNRVLIAVNPKAGSGRTRAKIDELATLLASRGLDVERFTDLDRVSEAAESLHERGQLRVVVGVGGDGTIAELVNRTTAGVPLTVFPQGTENLLAKYFGIRAEPQLLCDAIVAGHSIALDAGRANRRLFLLMASCGFDAEVIERLHAGRRGNIQHWDYAKPILDAVRSYDYPEMKVWYLTEQGAEETVVARWAFVFNLPCYARGLPLAPQAAGTDGLFDLCTFRQGSFWHGVRYLTAVTLGRHREMADCQLARVRKVRVEATTKVPFQIDGDPGGFLPLEIDVLPDRITLVVPPKPQLAAEPPMSQGRAQR